MNIEITENAKDYLAKKNKNYYRNKIRRNTLLRW